MANTKRTVKLRRTEDGRYVVDFKRAVLLYVMDETEQKKVERHYIPVRYHGADEFVNIPYRTFMQMDQAVCEVLSMPAEDVPIIEGETYDEHDRLVEMVRTERVYTLKLRTPEGREISVEGRIANA